MLFSWRGLTLASWNLDKRRLRLFFRQPFYLGELGIGFLFAA